MTTPTPNQPHNKHRRHQRGAAMLMLMLLVMLSLITLFTFRMDRKGHGLNSDRQTALALVHAKEALLGRAAANNDPGSLSCPSIDGRKGTADTTTVGPGTIQCGNGAMNSNLGWLPWKSLSTGQIRDGSNSLLWYMLSKAYVDKGTYSPPPNAAALQVTIVVVNVSPIDLSETIVSTTPVPNVIAAIISPGPPLQGQDRSSAAATDSSYVAAYLEVAADSTANTLTIKIEQKQNGLLLKYNDQYLLITTRDVLERSAPTVARSLASMLPVPPASLPPSGWVPTTGDWATTPALKRYGGWATSSLTQFTNNGTSATLTFTNCNASFNLTSTGSSYQVSRTGHC
jgi:hypothetical protein